MKQQHGIQIFLIIVISLLLPMHAAYADYSALREADFLSARAKFENIDVDGPFFYEQQKLKAFSGFSYPFRAAIRLLEHLSCIDYQAPFPQLKTLVLRC